MYFGLHLSDFGQPDRAYSDAVSVLRIGDAVVLPFAFEPGVAWFFPCFHPAEEGLKGKFHTDSNILQDLTVNSFEFGIVRLPCRHCLLLLIHRRRLALCFIADGSLVNKAVINITADLQRLIERSLLRMIGEQPVFYTNLVHLYIIPQYNVEYNYRDINTAKGMCRHKNDDGLSIPVAKARGFPPNSVTNRKDPARGIVHFYNGRGTCEQWIKEGKYALDWMRLSCHDFKDNVVRLALFVLAYNLGNFLRRLALPKQMETWRLTSLKERVIKVGARLVMHARRFVFQMAEVSLTRVMLAEILRKIRHLEPVPG